MNKRRDLLKAAALLPFAAACTTELIQREQCAVPIAMEELLNNPHEWVDPMARRWYVFYPYAHLLHIPKLIYI